MKLLILIIILPLYSYSQKPLKIKMQPRWREEHNDTTKAILLVSDSSSENGFKSQRCSWIEGYIATHFSASSDSLWGDALNWYETYLDQSKKPLQKSVIVWLSKEIK